jgi:Zn-dependent protease/predicted transcriptional regulator
MSGGLFQIARLFGIPVQVHWSFLLVFVWAFFAGPSEGRWDWQVTVWSFAAVLVVFACVVMHEFGHALTARRYGVQTHDIILSPIGGIARLERLPDKPWQEFVVAIAGPLVNIAISLFLALVLWLAPGPVHEQIYEYYYAMLFPESNVFPGEISLLYQSMLLLLVINLVLAAFNLLPAFPMDGGRMLRALLSIRLGRLKATRIAVYAGQGVAVLLLMYTVLEAHNLVLGLIALFIFIMARSEYRSVRLDTILSDATAQQVVRRQFTRLYASDPLPMAVNHYQQGAENSFLVFDEWQNLIGILPEQTLVAAAQNGNASQLSVGQLVSRSFEALPADAPLNAIFAKIYGQGCPLMPVYEQGQLIGVVDDKALKNFMRLHERRSF